MSTLALSLGILVAAAGCNGGGTTPAAAQLSNISGDYTGTMQDAHAGSGPATATLAQHGGSAGGTITTTTTGGTVSAQISLIITPSNSLSGAMVIDESNGATCTFSTSGTYNQSSNVINGSYTAVTNCSGDTGTYTLTQQCIDTATASGERRTMGLTQC